MRVGILVYSQTGNTLSVAAKLQDRLRAAGHSVALERITLAGERKQGRRAVELSPLPDVSSHELLVIGSPVEAFSLSPVAVKALEQVGSLRQKSVLCLVTQGFPFPWLGGNRAIRQMTALCEAKGAVVRGGAVVNWVAKTLDRRIADAVDKLAGLV
ncbi:MAG: flavodoxin [Candidatus Bipolaricaulis sp.]|nr:flavodoxin [Candidatus Bipolaricaulis sp.]MDD5220606.1 flavodoxin [Candidatus Bipolaricaulis sp.]MDD5645928.1 flavodoxin [Candidatus Bipolaricaulis sp.]